MSEIITSSSTPSASIDGPPLTLDLVRRAQEGDCVALNDLCARYIGRIHLMARARLGPLLRRRFESLDIAQDTILRVLTGLGQFECRSDATFLNWVSRLVENTIRDQDDHAKAGKRDVRKEDSVSAVSGDSPRAVLPQLRVDITQQLEVREELRCLEKALDVLKPADRDIILLRDSAGMTFPEIAEEMKMSPDAARMRYARAAERLAGLLMKSSEECK